MGLGLPELMVVLVIVTVLFGGKRLPELASGVGKAIRHFRKESGRLGSSAAKDQMPSDG